MNQDWYSPGASLTQFHNSVKKVNVIVGARGVGKTTSLAVDQVGHIWHNAGARCMNVRKSKESQDATTLHTFNVVFGNMGELFQDTGTSLFRSVEGGRRIRIPSRLAVEKFNDFNALRTRTKAETMTWLETEGNRLCGRIDFEGLLNARISQNNLRGLECSYMGFIEADLMERMDFDLAIPVVGRWKGADPEICDDKGYVKEKRIVLDTNPPGTRHWIAQLEDEWAKGNPDYHDYHFWHIKTEENRANLPEGYIESLIATYRKRPALLKKYVYGEYADAYDGESVLYQYDEETHSGENLPFPTGAYLVRGWDFGTNMATTWSAYWVENGVEYWWLLHEHFRQGSNTERHADEVLSITESEFPFWNDRSICAGVLDFCDPAGNNSNFGMNNPNFRSSVAILKTKGIHPGFSRLAFQTSIAIVNRLLQKRTEDDRPIFMIDRKSCPMCFDGLNGAYRWPKPGEAGYGGLYPVKGDACGDVDHPLDSARYAISNCMKLLKLEVEELAKPVGVLASKRVENPNPDRKR